MYVRTSSLLEVESLFGEGIAPFVFFELLHSQPPPKKKVFKKEEKVCCLINRHLVRQECCLVGRILLFTEPSIQSTLFLVCTSCHKHRPLPVQHFLQNIDQRCWRHASFHLSYTCNATNSEYTSTPPALLANQDRDVERIQTETVVVSSYCRANRRLTPNMTKVTTSCSR